VATGLGYRLLEKLGINALARVVNRGRYVVIMYHGVCDDDFDLLVGYDERHIRVSVFRQQLEHLKRCGYRFLSLNDMVSEITNGTPRGGVVLTFDDGFRNIVKNAYPLLSTYGAKGVFYLIADRLNGDEVVWTDYVETIVRSNTSKSLELMIGSVKYQYDLSSRHNVEQAMRDIKRRVRVLPQKEMVETINRLMSIPVDIVPIEFKLTSVEEASALDPEVLDIGCHTRSHLNLPGLDAERLRAETEHARVELEKSMGRCIRHFCYPAGAYDDAAVEAVRDAGFVSAVTTEVNLCDGSVDVFKIPRVYANEDMYWFKAVTSGSYFWASRVKQFVRGLLRADANGGNA